MGWRPRACAHAPCGSAGTHAAGRLGTRAPIPASCRSPPDGAEPLHELAQLAEAGVLAVRHLQARRAGRGAQLGGAPRQNGVLDASRRGAAAPQKAPATPPRQLASKPAAPSRAPCPRLVGDDGALLPPPPPRPRLPRVPLVRPPRGLEPHGCAHGWAPEGMRRRHACMATQGGIAGCAASGMGCRVPGSPMRPPTSQPRSACGAACLPLLAGTLPLGMIPPRRLPCSSPCHRAHRW